MNVLEEADSLINGERQQQYGNATESHQRIADLWAGYLGTDVTEFDVVNMMILLKVSRTRNQYHRDSYVDIAGYSALGERLKLEADGTGIPVDLSPWLTNPSTIQEIPEPRVWEHFRDIPDGVVVTDKDGDEWEGEVDHTVWNPFGGLAKDHWAPYTEVLEGLT